MNPIIYPNVRHDWFLSTSQNHSRKPAESNSKAVASADAKDPDRPRQVSLPGVPFQSIPISLQERVSGDWSWRHGSEKLRAARELGSPVTPLPPPITCAALWAEHQERRAGRLPQGHEGEGEMGKWKISILQLSQDGRGDRSQAGGRKPQDGMA